MQFRTIVNIENPSFEIKPLEPILCVGSCFADSIGQRFIDERFPATVNPFGVMYNPASVFHTLQRWLDGQSSSPRIVFLTLGTNHVYRLRETGEIVDNCQKRPQKLFQEEELSVGQCVEFLSQAADMLQSHNADVHIVITVSPIRYAKYGFHQSQLSKATLLMAADQMTRLRKCVTYFPAYEIVLDELRDYRFYQPDMIHPSQQAVEYIWEQLVDAYFSPQAKAFLQEWSPIKKALAHRPFNPDSPEYKQFIEEARQKEQLLMEKYNENYYLNDNNH